MITDKCCVLLSHSSHSVRLSSYCIFLFLCLSLQEAFRDRLQYSAFLNSLSMGGAFVLLSQREGWWESTGVRAGWDFIAVLWQWGVASSDPTDCWFNNAAKHRSQGVRIPFIEDNFNQPWLSCLCYCFNRVVSHFYFFLDRVSFSFRRVGNAAGHKTFLGFAPFVTFRQEMEENWSFRFDESSFQFGGYTENVPVPYGE